MRTDIEQKNQLFSIASISLRRQYNARSIAAQFQHQLVQTLDKPRRIFKLTAFGEQRLIKKHVRPVVEAFFIRFRAEALQQRMARVDFEYGFGIRDFLSRRL